MAVGQGEDPCAQGPVRSGAGWYRSDEVLIETTVSARRSLSSRATGCRTSTRRAGVVTTSSQRITRHLVFQQGLGQQLLQRRVLGRELLEALGVRDVQTAVLAPPGVGARFGEPVTATELFDREAHFSLLSGVISLYVGVLLKKG